jgi:hypothetical protein
MGEERAVSLTIVLFAGNGVTAFARICRSVLNKFKETLINSGNAEEFVLRDEAQGARSGKPART